MGRSMPAYYKIDKERKLDLLHSLASREAFEAARAEASELVPHGEHK